MSLLVIIVGLVAWHIFNLTGVLPQTAANEKWETFVINVADIEGGSEMTVICYPREVSVENYGISTMKNSTTICVSREIRISKSVASGWMADFQTVREFKSVRIKSAGSEMLSAQLSNFIIFSSNLSLSWRNSYRIHESNIRICFEYNGNPFGPGMYSSFNCRPNTVYGRYLYIWSRNRNYISNKAFAIVDVLVTTSSSPAYTDVTSPRKNRLSLIFYDLSPWSSRSFIGFWIAELDGMYKILIIILKPSVEFLGKPDAVRYQIGTEREKHGPKKPFQMTMTKTGFMSKVDENGKFIILTGKRNEVLSWKFLLEFKVLLEFESQLFHVTEKIDSNTTMNCMTFKRITNPLYNARVTITYTLRTELSPGGWLVVNMGASYSVVDVVIRSGYHVETVKSLKTLTISVWNTPPRSGQINTDKTNGIICSEYRSQSDNIPTRVEKTFVCLPQPVDGIFVVIYSSAEAFRVTSIQRIEVGVELRDHMVITRYWIFDLYIEQIVKMVTIFTGKETESLTSVEIFIGKELFIRKFSSTCFRYSGKSLRPRTKIKFRCHSEHSIGRYLHISKRPDGFLRNSLEKVIVWVLEYQRIVSYESEILTVTEVTETIVRTVHTSINWYCLYSEVRYDDENTGLWVFDFGRDVTVATVTFLISTDRIVIARWANILVTLEIEVPKLRRSYSDKICAIYRGHKKLLPTSKYRLTCNRGTRDTIETTPQPAAKSPREWLKKIVVSTVTIKNFKYSHIIDFTCEVQVVSVTYNSKYDVVLTDINIFVGQKGIWEESFAKICYSKTSKDPIRVKSGQKVRITCASSGLKFRYLFVAYSMERTQFDWMSEWSFTIIHKKISYEVKSIYYSYNFSFYSNNKFSDVHYKNYNCYLKSYSNNYSCINFYNYNKNFSLLYLGNTH
ncbi:hypothetical protein HELRODRAFT_174644 [Helobdella robusta]|uniref:Ig-like domain-containing protein n=1 Tax=Helobdella robusta TaxID=6412 RepID=T1F8C3_HELRO|nr:hypothetical protein HELRODRAFT_174644 [Helobdella robusta]ESO01681.1 hypothetical protein HELRODRAFT_174644 [Helobdella robusta]